MKDIQGTTVPSTGTDRPKLWKGRRDYESDAEA